MTDRRRGARKNRVAQVRNESGSTVRAVAGTFLRQRRNASILLDRPTQTFCARYTARRQLAGLHQPAPNACQTSRRASASAAGRRRLRRRLLGRRLRQAHCLRRWLRGGSIASAAL